MYWTHRHTLNRKWTEEVACMVCVCVCIYIYTPCMLLSSSISWRYNAPKIPGLHMVCICLCVCTCAYEKWTDYWIWIKHEIKPFKCIEQGWWTYRTCAQKDTWEDFLGMSHSPLFHAFYFFCPTCLSILWRILYIYTHLTVYRLYALPLLLNINASETLLHHSGVVLCTEWVFMTGAPAGSDVANTWH
jgi:hypothetical protein